ncbi:TcpQ domain-containing protein [Alphaproteobacteria bacterium]|nr:TcpQ domain-containing protein [Alphaproteobacteria bacterium]
MMRLTRLLPLLSVSAFAVLTLQTIPYAQAGFQWVPPEEEKAPAVLAPIPPVTAMPAPSFPQAGEVMPMPNDVLVPMVVKPLGESPSPASAPPRPLNMSDYNEPAMAAKPSYKRPYEDEPKFVPLRKKTIATHSMQTKVITPKESLRPKKLEVPELPAYMDSKPSTLPAPSYRDDRKTAKKDATPFTNFFGDDNDGSTVFEWLDSDQTSAEKSWESGKLDPRLTPVNKKPAPRMVKPAVAQQRQQNTEYETIQGFGSELPLALALSQVVPPRYSYSFGSGVNPGVRVSWNGGKPWNQVVNDMVKSIGVSVSISGKIIHLKQTGASQSSYIFETENVPTYKTASVKRRNIMDPGKKEVADEAVLEPVPVVEEEKNSKLEEAIAPVPSTVTLEGSAMPDSKSVTVAAEHADLIKPPPIVEEDVSALKNLEEKGDDFNFDFEDSYPEKAAKRPKLSQKIQKDIAKENIEMRMSSVSSGEILTTEKPYQPGRPYVLDEYKKPLYSDDPLPEFASAQDMEKKATKSSADLNVDVQTTAQSVSQKRAVIGDAAKPSNKVSAADVKMWEAQKGDSLKKTLVNWSREANINLVWNAESDYTISSNVLVNGTFKSAIKAMFAEGLPVESKPSMRFVDNPSANEPTTFIVGNRV